jgi:serine/threonine protein kinase
MQVGERIGPARLIGPGRALRDGELWRGQLPDGTDVAVKVLTPGLGNAARAARESTVLWRLAGHGAPRLLHSELSLEDTPAQLVLAWVDGVPAHESDLPARDLALAVAARYADLHEFGVLHGNVDPGNVLVDADGHVTLVDFGQARLLDGTLDPAPRPALTEATERRAVVRLLADLIGDRWPGGRGVLAEVTGRETGHPAGRAAGHLTTAPDSLRDLHTALARTPDHLPDQARPDVRTMVQAFGVGQPTWRRASRQQAGEAATMLRRLARLTGDLTAADLAEAWTARAAQD